MSCTSGNAASYSPAISDDGNYVLYFSLAGNLVPGSIGNSGSNLFWRPRAERRTSIAAGTLDTPTGIAIERHIFVAEKSDYYEIADALPKLAGWD